MYLMFEISEVTPDQKVYVDLDGYREQIADVLDASLDEVDDVALRFRAWNGDLDRDIPDRRNRAMILAALRLDQNMAYQIVD
mgnify:CR=1 FL=1